MQHVNLYKHLEQRPEVSEGVLQIALASIATVALIVCLALWLVVQNAWLQRELARANVTSEDLNMLIEKNTKQHDDKLVVEVEQLKQQFMDRQATLAVLEHAKKDQRQIFSSQLAGLGRQRIEGLWLNHIEFRRSGEEVALQGITRKPSLLPRYLQALGQEKAFAGLRFDVMRMQVLDESGDIAFEVSINSDNVNKENKS